MLDPSPAGASAPAVTRASIEGVIASRVAWAMAGLVADAEAEAVVADAMGAPEARACRQRADSLRRRLDVYLQRLPTEEGAPRPSTPSPQTPARAAQVRPQRRTSAASAAKRQAPSAKRAAAGRAVAPQPPTAQAPTAPAPAAPAPAAPAPASPRREKSPRVSSPPSLDGVDYHSVGVRGVRTLRQADRLPPPEQPNRVAVIAELVRRQVRPELSPDDSQRQALLEGVAAELERIEVGESASPDAAHRYQAEMVAAAITPKLLKRLRMKGGAALDDATLLRELGRLDPRHHSFPQGGGYQFRGGQEPFVRVRPKDGISIEQMLEGAVLCQVVRHLLSLPSPNGAT